MSERTPSRQGALRGLDGLPQAAALLLQQRYIGFLAYEARLASWELYPDLGLGGKVIIDLDAAAPVSRFHWPDDSKGAAPSWPSFRAAAVLGLLGLADDVDPHPAWASAATELRAWINSPDRGEWSDEEAEPHHLRLDGLIDRIAETPARTPAGIAAQVALALRCHDTGSISGISELAALRNAQASLERLADGGATAPHPDTELLDLGRRFAEAQRALVANAAEHPKPGWEAAEEQQATALNDAVNVLGERIAALPAKGPAGLAVKLRAFWTLSVEDRELQEEGATEEDGFTDRLLWSTLLEAEQLGGQADA